MTNKNSKYLNFIKEDILNNTYIHTKSPYHIMLSGCNIGVHMNHDYKKMGPYFSWIPDCFTEYCETRYGLNEKEIHTLFRKWYQHVVIKMFMDSPEGPINYPSLF